MSAQDSNLSKPVRYRKPKADVFTLLLGIALIALIVACVFAYLEIKEYGASPFSGAPSVAVPVERPANLAMASLPESQTTLPSPWRLHG